MVAFNFTNAFISEIAKYALRGATPPPTSRLRGCLANTAVLTVSSTLESFLAAELIPGNGYSRQQVAIPSDGAFNITNKRHEMPTISPSWTASGGALQFQTVFLMADGDATASSIVSSVNTSTDTLTINAHGYSNGQKLTFSADSGGSLPTGITAATIYQVTNVATNTFQLQPNGGGSTIDITGAGSGTIRARSANGVIIAYGVDSNPVTLADGQPYTPVINLIFANAGYISGV
ncbi:hypothetical protein JYQ62_22155 [Nostoc sp. UHCC 0702]|nr:hypothetical protein JYQ62_22155 [Nostoc sp. UHCC 0702]